jgi:hypothetical protein
MRRAMRRLGLWLLEHSTICQKIHWRSAGLVTLRRGDITQTVDDFGPTVQYEVVYIDKDYVVLRQYIRCADERSKEIDAVLARHFYQHD